MKKNFVEPNFLKIKKTWFFLGKKIGTPNFFENLTIDFLN